MVDYTKDGSYGELSKEPFKVELGYTYDGKQQKAQIGLTVTHGANGSTGAGERPVFLLINGTRVRMRRD